MTKWFFAITQDTVDGARYHGFRDCIRVAVKSALKNTSLVPHMIFDGARCELVEELESMGVHVIYYRLGYFDRIHAAQKKLVPEWPDYMRTAAGAFMRLEIPWIESEDQYVLYTDCDVMFLGEPGLDLYYPEVYAAASQFHKDDFNDDLNSGIMWMNLHRFKRDYHPMMNFLCENFDRVRGYDQELMRIYYKYKGDPLSPIYNWKPYWGPTDQAKIVHFHGPKPPAAALLLENRDFGIDDRTMHTWRHWFLQNPPGYTHFMQIWNSFLSS